MTRTLKITLRRKDGTETIYSGESVWRTDSTIMTLVEGPPLVGYDPEFSCTLEIHSALCRAAAIAAGHDFGETWNGEFQGGHIR